MMNSHKRLFLPFLLLLSGQIMGMQAEEIRQVFDTPTKTLFVFGDSFVDGGNIPRDGSAASTFYDGRVVLTDPWKYPYGMSVPGVPTGRFSDGRLLSDFIAMHLGLPPPVPYKSMNDVPPNRLKHGMNFAYGGTGVFDTSIPFPNMTVQINLFEKLIEQNVYNVIDLSNSMAMLSAFGNDYLYYLDNNGSIENFMPFTQSLVEQMTTNLIRVERLGVKKIVVTSVPPFGCIPAISAPDASQGCLFFFNYVSNYHNTLLKQAITNLNRERTAGTTFLYLDLYASFMSVIDNPSANNITNVYSACCDGVSAQYGCGTVVNGERKYKVCQNPESTLFWDPVHPSHAGWQAVYNNLEKGDLGHLLQF